MGGTNAHMILSEAPRREEAASTEPARPYVLTLTARSEDSLHELAGSYQTFLATSGLSLKDIVFTANNRRTHHEKRAAVIGSTPAEMIEKLEVFKRKDEHLDVYHGQVMPTHERGLAFVYSGQGTQWPGMGSELMRTEAVFREKMLEIEAALQKFVGWSLIEELNAVNGNGRLAGNTRLAETEVTQPAIFAMQLALTALWKSWGIEPEAVVGHSGGEIAAAQAAGVLTLEDAVRVVYHRSRLLQRVQGQGRMAAIGVSVEEAEKLIAKHDGLWIAAVNSPASVVLSGNAEALDEIITTMTSQGIFAQTLPINYASQSPYIDSLTGELTEAVSGLFPRPAKIAIFSTQRGELGQDGDYDTAYWAKNIRQTVLFGPAIQAMIASGINTFIEVSPHPVLTDAIQQCQGAGASSMVLPSLRRNQTERGNILRSLGALFTRGYPIRWEHLYPEGNMVDLPKYPWQNARYWLSNNQQVRYTDSRVSPGSTSDEKHLFYDLKWKSLATKPSSNGSSLTAIGLSWAILMAPARLWKVSCGSEVIAAA
jgi:acyl transferase domain-containing protein